MLLVAKILTLPVPIAGFTRSNGIPLSLVVFPVGCTNDGEELALVLTFFNSLSIGCRKCFNARLYNDVIFRCYLPKYPMVSIASHGLRRNQVHVLF